MRIPFIAQLNERLRYQLCVLLQPLPAKYGDVILQQNDYGDEMYILVSGMCSIFRADEAGKQKMDMRRKSLGGLNVDAMRAAAAAADSNSDPSQVGELDQYGERVQDLYGGSFFGEEALLNDQSTRETSIIGMAESNLLYLTRDSVNEKLKDQDRATFIDALKRFGDLRQRQKKNWAKRTEQLDKHIAKLQPPQELLRLRHKFDRNPEPKELTLLDSVIQGDHKRLLPEVLEAVHARMCVRVLPKGENAVVGGTNKHGLNFVLKGDLEATLVPVGKLGQGASDGSVRNLHVEHGSSDLRHTMSAPLGRTLSLRGRSKSDAHAHTTKISSGTCFSSSELIKTLKDPKDFKELKTYHVTSAIVRSDGATVLWLDKATWEWTRMRESQIEQGPSSFGVDDDEEEDDDGDDGRDESTPSEQTTEREEKPGLLVGGRGSSSNARGSKGVRFNLDDDQEKTARTPSSAAAAGSNAASSADLSEINTRLEKQEQEMKGLGKKLHGIEGMMQEMLTLMHGGGGGGGSGSGGSMPSSLQEGDPQLDTLARTQSSGGGAGARSTTPPRNQFPASRLAAVVAIGGSRLHPVVDSEPEHDGASIDSDDGSSTDSDHDEFSSAPPSGGAGARSATPPWNPQPQPQPEPEPETKPETKLEPEPEMMDVSALDGSSSDDEPPPSVPLQKRARARSTTPPRKRVGAGEARGSRLQPQPEPEPEPEPEMDEDSSDEEPPQVPPGRTSSRRRGEYSVESRIV